MSLQTIVDTAQEITFLRAPVVAQSMSRANYIKTATRGARIWQFTITPSPGLHWDQYRGVIETLQFMDRYQEHTITLANNANMAWITQYQGAMSSSEIAATRISSTAASTIVLGTLPSLSSSAVLFRRGDFIQPSGSRYPYTITADVLRGSGTTVNIPVNRPVLTDVVMANRAIVVGGAVSWQVIVTKLPQIGLLPGRLVGFDGDFECVEALV